jgi:hypothetical protein
MLSLVCVRLVESAPAESGNLQDLMPFHLVEAKNANSFLITVIHSGKSKNNVNYPADVLKEATPLFEGVRVFVKSDAEHLKGQGKDFRNLVGGLTQPRFVESASGGEIQAVLKVLDPTIGAKMKEALDANLADLFGFSIDVEGEVKPGAVREAVRFTRAHSVDLIIEPGAGGKLHKLIEACFPSEMATSAHRESAPQVSRPNTEKPDDAMAALRMVEALDSVKQSGLPDVAQSRIREALLLKSRFGVDDAKAAIQQERIYLSHFTDTGKVREAGGRIDAGESRGEKVVKMLDDFFMRKGGVNSIREAYVDITGDRNVTGRIQDADQSRLRESLNSSSWANVLGDSITRAMVRDYSEKNMYDAWRDLADVVPVRDFRTQERLRWGGYGNLPGVNEGAAYLAMTSPSDEKATYAMTKRGGTEDVTMEMIANDDVGQVRRIPTKLSRAAQRTLSKFAMDFLATNPTIYDSTALFTGGHGNLGSTALSSATLSAGRLAMMKQTEAGSSQRLGIPPAHLWVPVDLEEAAFELFRRTTNNDTDFVESLQMKVHPVWYWTDTNNWFLSADKMDIPCVEIGFLNGNETPELFVQDQPNVGSMFSNDKITYKIRHVYGGAVIDYRGLYGAVVA